MKTEFCIHGAGGIFISGFLPVCSNMAVAMDVMAGIAGDSRDKLYLEIHAGFFEDPPVPLEGYGPPLNLRGSLVIEDCRVKAPPCSKGGCIFIKSLARF